MANKNLQGTIEYYIKGQYGLIKGEDGKEYCFGRKAVTARAKLFNGDVVRFTVDQKHHILASSIDSIWGEMTSMFPEHFADNITNQADQIKRAFEVLTQARQDMVQTISAQDMTPEQFSGIKADAFDEVISMASGFTK